MVKVLMTERIPLTSTQVGVGFRLGPVARIPGFPPGVRSVHRPVCDWDKENGEVEHEC